MPQLSDLIDAEYLERRNTEILHAAGRPFRQFVEDAVHGALEPFLQVVEPTPARPQPERGQALPSETPPEIQARDVAGPSGITGAESFEQFPEGLPEIGRGVQAAGVVAFPLFTAAYGAAKKAVIEPLVDNLGIPEVWTLPGVEGADVPTITGFEAGTAPLRIPARALVIESLALLAGDRVARLAKLSVPALKTLGTRIMDGLEATLVRGAPLPRGPRPGEELHELLTQMGGVPGPGAVPRQTEAVARIGREPVGRPSLPSEEIAASTESPAGRPLLSRKADDPAVIETGRARPEPQTFDLTGTEADDILTLHQTGGGSTYSLSSGTALGRPGFAVAYPGGGKVLDRDLTKADIEAFIAENLQDLQRPNVHVGTFKDPESGKTFIEKAVVVPDQEAALQLGRKWNQQSIFDLQKMEVIQAGGSGEAPAGLEPLAAFLEPAGAARPGFGEAGGVRLPPSRLEGAAIEEFGITADPREAGFILADGRLLDFSGKGMGGEPGFRAFEHVEVGRIFGMTGEEALRKFQTGTGAVRVSVFTSPRGGTATTALSLEFAGPPTPAQRAAIMRMARDSGDIFVDVTGGISRRMGKGQAGAHFTNPIQLRRWLDTAFPVQPRPGFGEVGAIFTGGGERRFETLEALDLARREALEKVIVGEKLEKKTLNDLVRFGALQIASGASDFARWRQAMLSNVLPFGRMQIKHTPDLPVNFLEDLYQRSQKQFAAFVQQAKDVIPDTKRLLDAFNAGIQNKAWYDGAYEELKRQFGPDADLMVALIAATSPQARLTSVNVKRALLAYQQIKGGLRIEGAIAEEIYANVEPAIRPNLDRIRAAYEAGTPVRDVWRDIPEGGPKVKNFAENIWGDPDAVTIDRWMARQFGFGEKPSDGAIDFMAAWVRQEADRAGVTPRQYQASIWEAARVLEGNPPSAPLAEVIREAVKREVEEGLLVLPEGLSEAGFTNLGLAALMARGAIGATVGGVTGDAPEDRIKNALIGFGVGAALSPALIRRYVGRLQEQQFFGPKLAVPVESARVTKAELKAFADANPSAIVLDDLALKVDWSAVGSQEAFEDLLKKVIAARGTKGIEEARRGVITTEKRRELARLLGTTEEDLLARPVGQADSAEQVQAYIDIMGAALGRLEEANARYVAAGAGPLKETLGKGLQEELQRFTSIMERVYGSRAESGRALGVWGAAAQPVEHAGKVYNVAKAQAQGFMPDMDTVSRMLGMLKRPDQKMTFFRALSQHGLEAFQTAWINGLLATFQGNMANLLGNVSTMFTAPLERMLAGAFGTLRRGDALDRVFPGEGMAYVQGEVAAFSEAVIAAGKMFREGVSTVGGGTKEFSRGLSPEALDALGPFGRAVDIMSVFSKTIHSVDEFSKVIHARGELWAQAIRRANAQGLRGEAYEKFIHQFVTTIPDDVKPLLRETAAYQTFNQKLTGSLASGQRTISESPFLKFIAPFFRTPINVALRYPMERFPGLNMLVKQSRHQLLHGTAAERDLAVGKLTLGSLMVMTALTLFWSGKLTGRGPQDPKRRQQWKQAGWQEYSVRYQDARGKWHSIGFNRFDPWGQFFGIVADIGEISGELQPDELNEVLLAVSLAFANNFTSKTFMTGTGDALETLTARTVREAQGQKDFFQKFFGSFVPTGVAQISRELDPTVREAYTLVDELVSRTPLSKLLFPRRYINGQPITRAERWGPDLLSPIPVNETSDDPVAVEIMRLEIGLSMPPRWLAGVRPPAVGPETPKSGVELTPKQYDDFVRWAGNELKLPADEVAASVGLALGKDKEVGMWDLLGIMMKSPGYAALTDGPFGGKARVVRGIVNGFRAAARARLLQEHPDLLVQMVEKGLERAEALGGLDVRQELEQTPGIRELLRGTQ